MTDQELLRLAALAAGYKLKWSQGRRNKPLASVVV